MELVVDNFAGGGGASLGIVRAIGRPVDIAINHDRASIEMHRANHPETLHLCEDVWAVDPVKACAGRPVGLAWFSPDCTHFSKAKGGKPRSKKIRGLAWVVVRWAKAVRPRVICLENVEEFRTWGPLLEDGRPCPRRKGVTFNRWRRQLERLGYRVESRELVAADYGAPTTRKRLFVIARCDGDKIVWPEATHAKDPAANLHTMHLAPWRSAAECIDWSLPCPSIFERTRPLADATLRRIAEGLRRYVFGAAEPFLVVCNHAGGFRGQGVDEPMPTICASRDAHGLVVPAMVEYHSPKRDGDNRVKPVDGPLPTQTVENRFALMAPTLVQTGYGEREGQAPRAPGIEKPLGTVVGSGKHALVSAFLAQQFGNSVGRDARVPLSTAPERVHHGLAAVHLTKMYGTCTGQDARKPMPTVTGGGNHVAEVRAFLVKYYGTGCGQDPRDPMATVTAKDRMGLVTIQGADYQIVDIGLRMLQPRELARAQGFPDSYILTGTKTSQVARIGNSVCPALSEAIVRANYVAAGGACGRVA